MIKITTSGLIPVAQTYVTPSNEINPLYNHLFATASYFNDTDFATAVTPSAGSISVSGMPYGASEFDLLADGALDATSPKGQASTSAPLSFVTSVPSGIVGATHYQLTIVGRST